MSAQRLGDAARPPTICKCGGARSYHRSEDHRGHEYEPRYESVAWGEGYHRGLKDATERLERLTLAFEAYWYHDTGEATHDEITEIVNAAIAARAFLALAAHGAGEGQP